MTSSKQLLLGVLDVHDRLLDADPVGSADLDLNGAAHLEVDVRVAPAAQSAKVGVLSLYPLLAGGDESERILPAIVGSGGPDPEAVLVGGRQPRHTAINLQWSVLARSKQAGEGCGKAKHGKGDSHSRSWPGLFVRIVTKDTSVRKTSGLRA